MGEDIAELANEIDTLDIACDTYVGDDHCPTQATHYLIGPCSHPGAVCSGHLGLFQMMIIASEGIPDAMKCTECGEAFAASDVRWEEI